MNRKLCSISLMAALIILCFQSAAAIAGEARVETISVSIEAAGAPPPPRVAQRMEASIATIGEHVLVGKKPEEINENKTAFEKVVREVLDRVLVGYSVQQVQIEPNVTSRIQVTLLPWGEVVREVSVELDLSAISPELQHLVKKDLGDMEDRISGVLVGLPTDAVDWAGGVSKAVIREILASQLPEFRANLDIISGPHTQVKLALAPVGPTVQDVQVIMQSHTIPNILLWEARPQVIQAAKTLRGLPVAFVERNQEYFRQYIVRSIAGNPATRRYGLTLTPQIRAGTDTEIQVIADTAKYKVSLEGYLDIDKDSDNIAAKLHAGKKISDYDEAFMEITLLPSSMTWEFVPGWGREIGSKTVAGLKYNLSDHHEIIWMNQEIAPRWTLRVERIPDLHRNEVGVRYKLHEFLSAEYVLTNDDRWIRLVGNL
jgi:hypothetical protein